jgi:hypothetical protein
MARASMRRWRWLALSLLGVVAFLGGSMAFFWGDLVRTALDPHTPFQTYTPPPAPDYALRSSWALAPTRPDRPSSADPPADVFFVSPTTFDGGKDWNAPLGDGQSDRLFRWIMAPNYAGPFVRVGRIFAPRYRQASLYSLMTLHEDAREARAFAYADVAQAFRYFLDHDNHGRPLVIVGVEQGGTLAARLLAEQVAGDPAVRARLAAAYLVETVVPDDSPPIQPCERREQAGCLAAWASITEGHPDRARLLLDRALVWGPSGELENLQGRSALCFNPLFGAVTDLPAPARFNLGAANATGLEWGARPAFMARQVSARCEGGVLRVSAPQSGSLKPSGSWIDRRRTPGFNVFYADLESDARARVAALVKASRAAAPGFASEPAENTTIPRK